MMHASRRGRAPAGRPRSVDRRFKARPLPSPVLRPAAPLADILIVELATAADTGDGMSRVVPLLRAGGCLERVEWWAPAEDGRSFRLETASGSGAGRRTAFPVGGSGALVLVGDDWAPGLADAVSRFADLLRHRSTEERLAAQAIRLLRQNEALEDFAALVAHELKSVLFAALHRSDATSGIEDALALVDSILEVARSESAPEKSSSASRCLDEVVGDLGAIDAEVIAELPEDFPMPPAALRVLLRNLVSNALAANAKHIRVSVSADAGRWRLLVDDDGVGIGASKGYAAGSGVGLGLCRRLAARFGGVLDLQPGATGGTCATFVLAGGGT